MSEYDGTRVREVTPRRRAFDAHDDQHPVLGEVVVLSTDDGEVSATTLEAFRDGGLYRVIQ